MSKNEKPDPRLLAALLKAASAKLGTTPEALSEELKSGKLDSALGKLPEDRAAQLRAAAADPKRAEQLLRSPQARAIIGKLSGKGGG